MRFLKTLYFHKEKILNYFLLFTIALIPFHLEKYIKGAWITSTDILIASLFFVWLILVDKRQIKFKKLPLFPWIVALLIFFFISISNSINVFLSLKEIIKIIFIFAFFYLLIFNLNNRFSVHLLPKIITICASIVCIWFIADFLLGKVEVSERTWYRAFGPYTHLNALGAYFTITIPFSFFLIFTSYKFGYKLFSITTFIIQMIALFLTFSRASWLAVGIVLFLLFLFRFRIKGVLYFSIVILVSFILSSWFFPTGELFKRFLSTFDLKDGSVVARLEFKSIAVSLMKNYPLTGVGMGNFKLAAKEHFNKDVDEMTHNMFLQYGVEAGIFAMLILFMIVIKYFRDAFIIYKNLKMNNYLSSLLFCSVMSFLGLIINSQFGDPFIRAIKEFFAITLALPYLIKSIQYTKLL